MRECTPASSPMDLNQRLSKEMCPKSVAEREEMSLIPYQQAIGFIMYDAKISRPDISFAVSALCRYNTNYGRAHWTAVKRVLRYLKGTIDLKLTYRKDSNDQMVGYCDADWAGNQDERRSNTGYVFVLQGGAISWATRKQPTIALSSTEAEFMSMVAAIQEALWLKRFEGELFADATPSIQLNCDNQGAIKLATNNNYHARTKHIDVKNYFIREKLAEDIIKLSFLSTSEMIANIITKPKNVLPQALTQGIFLKAENGILLVW
ncbi:secreted RxLR effector protein 161-like [Rhagoletis pomonella]|uniref:secreted RxLR effector protein 161-like n=1 Tax=Rhagoletis pomonella TaxID=28610 RepID=UPI001785C054|nr:secreted RxLR effector protein 161-like [Rhagoletis pomonella]